MKWLLPLLALAALAAGIWYFTRDDSKNDVTPTAVPTVAATIAAKAEGSVQAMATTVGAANASVVAAGGTPQDVAASIEGTVRAGVAGAQASVVGAVQNAAGTVQASGMAGTVEAGVAAAQGSVQAGVAGAQGSIQAGVAAAQGTVEAGVGAVKTGVADGAATVEAASATGVASPAASPVASPAAAGTLTLEAVDIAFIPTELTMSASAEPVTIKMENTGAALHNFSIDSLKIDVDVNPGETVDIVIPAGTAPGTYDFYCNVPGHKEAGMVGTLVVE